MSEGITNDFLRESIKKSERFPGVEYKIGQHALDNMKGKIESFVDDLIEKSIVRATTMNGELSLTPEFQNSITIREHDVVMGTVEVYCKHRNQVNEWEKIPLNERRGADV